MLLYSRARYMAFRVPWPEPGLVFRRTLSTDLAQIGPLPEYLRLVSEKKLRPDEDQMRAVVKLQRLCEELLEYTPPIPKSSVGGGQTRTFTTDEHIEANTSRCDMVATSTGEDLISAPKGLWIYGEVGTGKSMAMDLFFNSMPSKRKKRVHFNAFIVSAFAHMHQWSQRSKPSHIHVTELVAQDLFDEAWLLCFDEFQITDVATATVLRQVLHHIFRMGGVVVATSNRDIQDLHKGGFHRERHSPFIDLLSERLEVIHLRGKIDYREQMMIDEGISGKHNGVYYRLDDPDDVDAFIARVAKLFFGTRLRKETFKVYGRDVVVKKAANGMALVTFDELCGTTANPMGPADFLMLCQRYHTIVLQSIPRMGLEQKNEARRFITFVDAAYENKVRLVMSADADPEHLFILTGDPAREESSDQFMHREMMGDLMGMTQRGTNMARSGSRFGDVGRLAIFTAKEEEFAFKRAVSRLKEMRTEAWTKAAHIPRGVDFGASVADNGRCGDDAEPYVSHHDSHALSSSSQEPALDASPRHGETNTYASDDFGDEASYAGYIRQYKRFNPDDNLEVNTNDTRRGKGRNSLNLPERHFWGMGLWGAKAGKWGVGVKAFWDQVNSSASTEKADAQRQEDKIVIKRKGVE
ncbi:hypothetical protein PhCBS80983_g03837 [Powellomyces hirtus]|uniref:AAA+ ATPase domain-containing protein n=1 Tax=Powellomyces hirtus TaxID=109895 RepID=A0A507E252_9FUNG|nr:hypothetical protein PhCBS80983_g03837 [Powellomyces hirtus]